MEKIITVDESGDLKKDDKLFIFNSKDFIIIRKIKQPCLSERFINLANTINKRFQEKGVNKTDVVEAIQWA